MFEYFLIRSYVATMSADFDHLGWRSGSVDTILKVYYLGPSMKCLLKICSLVSWEIFKHFPLGAHVKTMSADSNHLGWRSVSLDTILKGDHQRPLHQSLSWVLIGLAGSDEKILSDLLSSIYF